MFVVTQLNITALIKKDTVGIYAEKNINEMHNWEINLN